MSDMSEKDAEGCVAPAGGPVVPKETEAGSNSEDARKDEATMSVMVGKEAPDFEASAYHEGGFIRCGACGGLSGCNRLSLGTDLRPGLPSRKPQFA